MEFNVFCRCCLINPSVFLLRYESWSSLYRWRTWGTEKLIGLPKVTQQVSDKAMTSDSWSNALHTRPFGFFPLGRKTTFIFIKVQLQTTKFLGAKLHTAISHHSVGTLSIHTEILWIVVLNYKDTNKIWEERTQKQLSVMPVSLQMTTYSLFLKLPTKSIKTCKCQISNYNSHKCFAKCSRSNKTKDITRS